jgi:hypothetical protein
VTGHDHFAHRYRPSTKDLIVAVIDGGGIMIASMRRLVFAGCLAVLALAVPRAQSRPAEPSVLLTGARILDAASGTYVAAPFVLIKDGRIASIGAKEPEHVPDNAKRLDVKGATLVPGLVDGHAALAPTPDLDTEYFTLMSLAHGVTAVRATNLRTTWAVAQKRRAETGNADAPRVWVGGRGFDQGARPDLWLFDAGDVYATRAEAARQVAAGVDWLAGYDHLPSDLYRELVAAARAKSARVSAMPGASSMLDLAAAGVSAIDSLEWPLTSRKIADDTAAADRAWTEAKAAELNGLIRRLVAARVTLVPLLAGTFVRAYPADVEKDAGLDLLPGPRKDALLAQAKSVPRTSEVVSRRAFVVKGAFLVRFIRAGGVVAAGTGFDLAGYPLPGAGLHTELAALVRAGLTPADAIRAATVNGAKLLGAEQALGVIAVGRDADLFVVQGDPLKDVSDLARITHVIRRGDVLDPKALKDRAIHTRD